MEAGADPLGFVALTVQDTGEGMDEETRAQIFEPFYTTKEFGRGTGLGLAMVYGVVKQGDGYIAVTSAPDEGARFDLFFPVASEQALQEPAAVRRTLAGRDAGRILLVEDEASIRDVAARVLKGRGYEVLEASDGLEALGSVDEGTTKIDLLITDVIMPRMGGVKLASRLRTQHPQLPVLYMSGYTEETFESAALVSGLDHYMQKPFTPDDLLTCARKALRAAEVNAG
jgi:CheY-like chemotaxis protein